MEEQREEKKREDLGNRRVGRYECSLVSFFSHFCAVSLDLFVSIGDRRRKSSLRTTQCRSRSHCYQ